MKILLEGKAKRTKSDRKQILTQKRQISGTRCSGQNVQPLFYSEDIVEVRLVQSLMYSRALVHSEELCASA